MASQTPVVDWALQFGQVYRMSVSPMSWVNSWLPGFFEFETEVTTTASAVGRGTSRDEHTAFSKSVAEAIERIILNENSLTTSNGLAVHTDLDQAKLAARNEILERDSFLCHYLTKTPFLKPELELSGRLGAQYEKIKRRLSRQDITIRIGQLKAPEGGFGFVVASFGMNHRQQFGTIVGLGYNEDKISAFESALIECMRNTVSFIDGNAKDSVTLPQFLSNTEIKSSDHDALALHLNSGTSFMDFFNVGLVADSACSSDNYDFSIKYDEFELPGSDPAERFPGFCVRASSDRLQNLFFGRTLPDKINIPRLREFSKNSALSWDDILTYPHPLG